MKKGQQVQRLAWIELRGPEGHRSTCIRNSETPAGFKPNPPKPSVEKLPDVAFWRPKERWRKANATAWHHLTGSGEIAAKTKENQAVDGHGLTATASLGLNLGAPRGTVQHASETGKPQQDSSPTRQNHPSKNCLTLLSDAPKKDEERPTGPTQPKQRPQKVSLTLRSEPSKNKY